MAGDEQNKSEKEEFERSNKKRSVARQLTTKLLSKIELIYNDENFDKIEKREELSCLLDQLREKRSTLKDLDNKIETFVSADDFEKEIISAEEYSEKIVRWEGKIGRFLKLENETRTFDSSTLNANGSVSMQNDRPDTLNYDENSSNLSMRMSLPKLALPRFFGDTCQWLEYWGQFEDAIHKNKSLTNVERFHYLKCSLGGSALNAIKGLALTEQNYEKCIQLLKSRFGRHDIIINSHMTKLLNLEPIRNSSNIKALRMLYDQLEVNIRSLESLNVVAGSYGQLLCPIVMKLLPNDLSLEYNRVRKSKSEFNILELMEFFKSELETRECQNLLEHANVRNDSYTRGRGYDNNRDNKRFVKNEVSFATCAKRNTCLFCDKFHPSLNCKTLSAIEKRSKLKKEGRCYRCFEKGSHLSSSCKEQIPPCKTCKSVFHNELFCLEKKNISAEVETPQNSESIISSVTHSGKEGSDSILPTCAVRVRNPGQGSRSKIVSVLFDSASSCSFVTKDIASELNLVVIRKEILDICTFGNAPTKTAFDVATILICHINDPSRLAKIEVFITDKISHAKIGIPKNDIQQMLANASIPANEIALVEGKRKIDILLGCDVMWRFQTGNRIELERGLYCIETLFGFFVSGTARSSNNLKSFVNLCVLGKNEIEGDCKAQILNERESDENLNLELKKLWELDNLFISNESESSLLNCEIEVLRDFENNLKYENGRYEVNLPFKREVDLPDNLEVSKGRLTSLVSRFKRDPALYETYKSVFEEQLRSGVIEEVDITKDDSMGRIYYAPHHPVIREQKESNRTRLRIVFDMSSKEKGCLSLNDNLHSGPNLNPNLLTLLLKFRMNRIGLIADIEKAFLRVGLNETDRNCQRFIWIDKMPPTEIKVYRNTTVSFGVKSSPFLLAATIKHHIKKFEISHPSTYKALNDCLYVDDFIISLNDMNEAIETCKNAKTILASANMNLREWRTNSTELSAIWQNNNFEKKPKDNLIAIKVLGIIWDTVTDELKYDLASVLRALEMGKCTKRSILQMSCKLFDPMGLIAAFTIRAKILLQETWQRGLTWDEELPKDLKEKWKKWNLEIAKLSNLSISRSYFSKFPYLDSGYEIHVFCDASEAAYGCVAYIRYPAADSFIVSFITAKARVAPVKKITLPRLELSAATIGARVLNSLKEIFKIGTNYTLWSDSTVALHWIKGNAKNWKPYVSNRVNEIQGLTEPSNWRHCRGNDNPADLLTRGCSADDLISDTTNWWKANSWLGLPESQWIKGCSMEMSNSSREPEVIVETRSKAVNVSLVSSEHQQANSIDEILNKYSSWNKLQRVVAWCLRFIENCKVAQKKKTFLTTEEIQNASRVIVKRIQLAAFKEDIDRLQKGKSLKTSSNILPLAPFLDSSGVLRVGGRLRHSSLSDSRKHPILLPKNHHVCTIIVKHYHEMNLHGGIQLTSSALMQRFWIINVKKLVRNVIFRCMKCYKQRASTETQFMSDLPSSRITPSRVFSSVGTDFAGPFLVTPRRGRGVKSSKSYVCIFVCFVTKAVHLEIVSDLSSEAFLACLRRFTARRGKPAQIWSDCGTNYVGAERELRRFVSSFSSNEELQNHLLKENIVWRFNPPGGPHHGGLWETTVRSMKLHLKKTVGDQVLTIEEFMTLITQVEACLNSRPLTPMSTDTEDLQPLTPGHFLIGAPLTALPENDLVDEKIPILRRWKLTQQLVQRFWKRWSNEYLSSLQQRRKWTKSNPNIEIGQLVLVKEDNLPPLRWKLGRVTELLPGRDNRIRVVKLKTATGELIRPIVKISKLPIYE